MKETYIILKKDFGKETPNPSSSVALHRNEEKVEFGSQISKHVIRIVAVLFESNLKIFEEIDLAFNRLVAQLLQ